MVPKVIILIDISSYSGRLFSPCYIANCATPHTWRPIVFIQPGVQDMSIIICAYKLEV